MTVINPADPESVPLSVNPLAPEPGYPVQAHIDMVRALFLAAFDAREPFPQIMSQALQRAYEECGWDPLTGAGQPGAVAPPTVPTLARLQAAALAVIEDVGYGRELPGRRARASSTCGSGRCAPGRPAGSSRAGTRPTSARCCAGTWCSRSRTSPTTRTRRSSSAR